MTRPVTLLLGVHAHQPVGNFPEVIAEAHERCYRPFLETLADYPQFRFSAHFSGWLLDELQARYPDDMALLRTMVSRGQVEMFGAGDCEPVLAAIPHRDRVSQIRTLSDKLETRFGRKPQGAWLTERVWESSVVPSLADSGIRYVLVDDYHFLCTGRTAGELDGFHTTEEDGRTLDLFPISEALRYRFPFAPAAEAVAYMEQMAREGHEGAIYFDDIEKFGIWPETYAWVYEKGWLRQFIEGVLRSPLIRTAAYQDFHAASRTRGIVYLPTASYIEMNEWTLPAEPATRYAKLVEQEKAAGRYEQTRAFVRGGIWRNFLTRYPESNWMHKRMLRASWRLAALPAQARTPAMSEALHRAQANDAYWHGLFGGLYLPHLRRAVWHNLLRLETLIDAASPRGALERADIDHDGHEEMLLHTPDLQIALRLDGNGAIHEFDARALAQNFGDTLARRPEHYHRRIGEDAAEHDGAGIASAHDRVTMKHRIAPEDLWPDARPRALFLDALHPDSGELQAIDRYELLDVHAPLGRVRLAGPAGGGRVEKTYTLEGAQLSVTWRALGLAGWLVTEINLAMPCCDGYAGRYILADGSVPCGFGQTLAAADCTRLTLDDRHLGAALELSASRPVAIEAAPLHTVSLSEAGFEKIMQAATLRVGFALADGQSLTLRLALKA